MAYQGSGIKAGAGSHNRVCAGRTIDLRTGHVLSIADLFKPKTEWRTRIRDEALSKAEKALSTPPGAKLPEGRVELLRNPREP